LRSSADRRGSSIGITDSPTGGTDPQLCNAKLRVAFPPDGIISSFKYESAASRTGITDEARGRLLLIRNPSSGRKNMTEHSLWRFSRALHRAINERQPEDLEALIDDDVDWAIYGPIDMFPFLGARRGKEAVLEVIRQIADNVRVHRFDRETIMLGVDSASSMLRYSLTMLDSSKPISLRLAHFAQFKAGRLLSMRVLVDSFDLVEQALGRPIHLPKIASMA
jgi:ketosteroid isomerase-like protein